MSIGFEAVPQPFPELASMSEAQALNARLQALIHTMAVMLSCAQRARADSSPPEGTAIVNGMHLATAAIALGKQADALIAPSWPANAHRRTLVILMGCAEELRADLLALSAP